MEQCVADGLLRDYTIEVHAMKNTSRMLGHSELSERFHRMEDLGNAEDLETIQNENPDLMTDYRALKEVLRPFAKANLDKLLTVDTDTICNECKAIYDAMEAFDIDKVDESYKKMQTWKLPEACEEAFEKLGVAVSDVDMDGVLALTTEIENLLKE